MHAVIARNGGFKWKHVTNAQTDAIDPVTNDRYENRKVKTVFNRRSVIQGDFTQRVDGLKAAVTTPSLRSTLCEMPLKINNYPSFSECRSF